jgi:hypothetical protein
MCDYVNDEENKNERLHVDNEIETEHAVSKKLIEVIEDLQVKIEDLTRKVDSIKELLPHENSRTFCQNCVDPDNAQTKNKNLIANHLNLQSQVNNNITNKPAAINAKQQSSKNGSDSQRKQNFSSFIEIQKKQQNLMNEIINLENHTSSQSDLNQDNNSASEPKFKTVQRRKPRQKYNIGESDENINKREAFVGTVKKENKNKKIWLFIAGAKSHVTENMVKQHISSKLKSDSSECNVKELQTFYQKSDNKCFLIGVQPAYKEAVYDKNFWPRGIRYSRFDFRKGEHFLDSNIKVNSSPQRAENTQTRQNAE